jgi:hypothetical protein
LKAEPAAKVVPVARVVRMRPALAAQMIGKPYARIPWPRSAGDGSPLPLKVGDRLFLVEFAGAETGRGDLVGVIGFENAKGFPAGYPEAPGDVWVRRGYCTHRVGPGANVEDVLAAVSYHAAPSGCEILSALPAPSTAAPEPGAHVIAPEAAA